MNKSILTEKEANLMETIVIRYGSVVSFDQIYELLKKEHSRDYIREIVSKSVKNGWFIRIKKSLYIISDLFNRGNTTFPQYILANLIVRNSYVSFGQALQYHGMFDQLIKTTTSISLTRYKTIELLGFQYRYINTQEKYFFGWEEVVYQGQTTKIALPEKALIDTVQFSRSNISVDMVIEKITEFKDQINFIRLNEYLSKSPIAVQKIFGFILDLLGIESGEILKMLNKNDSRVYLVRGSNNYNSKWNVYYDDIFKRYQK
ncbi:MAG: type IV toxin-antitoxin system AbiEi family antitoxin [bacterium]